MGNEADRSDNSNGQPPIDSNQPGSLPEHVAENRAYWDGMADDWVAMGERAWNTCEPTWGIWGLPEAEVQMLPADMAGMKAIELGCGTGYVSAWMICRGAQVVGIDNSEKQLATASRLASEHGASLELHHGNAEVLPFPDGSFDFAISEYGAAIWCDPDIWIPEAWRVLKPGGTLVFLGNHPLAILCTPLNGDVTDGTLHRSSRDLHRQDWREVEIDPGGIDFNHSHAEWLKLFRETGFDVVDYRELFAPETATEDRFSVPASWAKRWPSEQVWKLKKRGSPDLSGPYRDKRVGH